MVSLENEHIKNISEGAGFKFLSSFSIEIHPGVHFIKLKRQFRHFKCQNMGILNVYFWTLKLLFCGILNANISNMPKVFYETS